VVKIRRDSKTFRHRSSSWDLGLERCPIHTVTGRGDFRRDVQPLLKRYCIECHGPTQQMRGFRLDRRRDAMRGGTNGNDQPGNAAAGRFYLKLIR
jgi:hypothetical protein